MAASKVLYHQGGLPLNLGQAMIGPYSTLSTELRSCLKTSIIQMRNYLNKIAWEFFENMVVRAEGMQISSL